MRHLKRNKIVFILVIFLLVCNIIWFGHYSEHLKIADISSNCSKSVIAKWIYNSCESEIETTKGETSRHSQVSSSDKQVPALELPVNTKLPSALKLSSDTSHTPGPELSATQQLPISRIVHQILWTDTLTFRNYLSILSVWKKLKPYLIMLHTRQSFKTRPSQFDYNDWFDKATSRIPSLQVEHLGFLDTMEYSAANEVKCALSVLRKTGGIYVNINTIINAELWLQRNDSLQTEVDEHLPPGFIIMIQSPNMTNMFLTGSETNGESSCVSPDLFTGSETCFTISKDIFPVNIMWTNSSFGSLARELFYGTASIPKPSTSFPPIPKYVHYVWFGKNDINYSMFLSFLSTQRFVKPLKIFIYTNTKTRSSSFYFDKMAAYSNVEIVYYGPLTSVYQTHIASDSHASDIVRADVLLRHGGIYLDVDVYWMKPVDDLLSQGYETVASLDFMKDMYPRQGFPDTINMGVVLARPGSRFIALWQESFKEYTGKHQTYHAVEIIYKLYEEHPNLLFIDSRLQIMCFEFRCHPLWLDNYKNASADNSFDFRKDVYTVHFTHPRPKSFKSEELLKNSKGFFADMARHISGIH